MNKFVLLTAALSLGFLATTAQAKTDRKVASSQLCGEMGSTSQGPNCKAGTPCPMFIRLVYTIANDSGVHTVETKKPSVLGRFGNLRGDWVCATGSVDPASNAFEVTSIQLNDQE